MPSSDAPAPEIFKPLDPAPRLLMGPGPVNVYPSVLHAMATPMLGQFDPQFTAYMNEVMVLYRQVFQTKNQWTLLINGTARAGIEACLTSMITPGDKVLVLNFGRFGHLLTEISERCGATVVTLDTAWGTVFEADQVRDAIKQHRPQIVATVHGDTSTTMAQPLAEIGAACREFDALLYVDATATLGGMEIDVDGWQLDAVTSGLQKCLSGPPGSSPITINQRIVDVVMRRKHIEEGIRPAGYQAADGQRIQSNYFDLPMLLDYWGPQRLNHHTESTSMLYAARECARVILSQGLQTTFARHKQASTALRAGLRAMGLELYGDENHRMDNVTGVHIPSAVDSDKVRAEMLVDFGIEIGTSFGSLHGVIWRIGTMGYVCSKPNILRCISALEAALRRNGYVAPPGAAVDAVYGVYDGKK
ncbi:MAG: alanine--glyoxylate aminotransferase family protein [Rhodospirillales bacterium]|nr:alanine--glyoxylate aminotransferase family protein [Rhodospirillales bacterium]